MRKLLGAATLAGMVAASGAAHAAGLDIRNAALRVVVIPEARSDVSVTVVKANPRLPLQRLHRRVRADHRRRRLRARLGPLRRPADQLRRGGRQPLDQRLGRRPLHLRRAARGRGAHAAGRPRRRSAAACSAPSRPPSASIWSPAAAASGSWPTSRTSWPFATAARRGFAPGPPPKWRLDATGSGGIWTGAAARALDARCQRIGRDQRPAGVGPGAAQATGSGSIRIAGGQSDAFKAHVSGSGGVAFLGRADSVQSGLSGSGAVEVGAVAQSLGCADHRRRRHARGRGRRRRPRAPLRLGGPEGRSRPRQRGERAHLRLRRCRFRRRRRRLTGRRPAPGACASARSWDRSPRPRPDPARWSSGASRGWRLTTCAQRRECLDGRRALRGLSDEH